MTINELDCLLFDFDGTLFDSESVIYQTWLDVFRNEGYDLPLEIYNRCIGSDFKQWSPQTYLEELTGKNFDWDNINNQRQITIEKTLHQNFSLIDGAKELILTLVELKKHHSIQLGVVSSSTHRWVDQWLEKNQIIECFDLIICSDDVNHLKPNPEPYLIALEKLGVNANKTLVIEDSLNGAQAAYTANTQVAVIPNYITKINTFPKYCTLYADIHALRKSLALPGE